MNILFLNPHALTDAVFGQMMDIESNSGVSPYTPDELLASITMAHTWLCMDDKTVAGFITVHPDEDYDLGGLHIGNLNVAAPYRRQGLAQMMIRTVCAHYAQEYAGYPVSLDVKKTNTPARCLYEKLGFTISDLPSENGPTDLVMTASFTTLLG